jgi:hypothetical protein
MVGKIVLVLLLTLGASLAQGQPSSDPNKAEKGKPEKTRSKLEELIDEALRNNPDIRVAEAKMREAEAELARTRLVVTQKLVQQQAELEAARKTLEEAEKRYQSVIRMKATMPRAVSLEDERASEVIVQRAKADLAKVEAEAPYLLGRNPVAKGAPLSVWVDLSPTMQKSAWLWEGDGSYRFMAGHGLRGFTFESKPVMQGPMAERIRKALDTPVELKIEKVPAGDALQFLLKQGGDLPVVNRVNLTEPVQLVGRDKVPLGAALQMLLDQLSGEDVHLLVREYGILVTTGKAMPAGAVELHEFWKGSVHTKPATETKPDKKPEVPR